MCSKLKPKADQENLANLIEPAVITPDIANLAGGVVVGGGAGLLGGLLVALLGDQLQVPVRLWDLRALEGLLPLLLLLPRLQHLSARQDAA